MLQNWLSVSSLPPAIVLIAPPIIDPVPTMPPRNDQAAVGTLAWHYLRKQTDAFGVLGGSLAMLGLWLHRRTLARRDQVAVCLMSGVNFAAIAVHQWQSHDIIGRYFFPIVLVTMPYIALAVLELATFLSRRLARFELLARRRWATPRGALVGLTGLLVAIGCLDATTNNFDSRRQRRDLGQWVLAHLGPNQLIVGPETRELMLMHYSQGRYCGLLTSDMDSPWFRHIMQVDPIGLVVIWKDRPASPAAALAARFRSDPQLQPPYQAVPAEQLPASCRRLTVLVRPAATNQLARNPFTGG
jgi:hypothetical protein